MAKPRTPRFYFSLRSPYSWLAYRDLLARHPDLVPLLDWRPYYEPDEHSTRLITELGGDLPYTDMSRAKHLYILQDVGRLAAERGLELSWPVDKQPVWEVPHLGYLHAHRHGLGARYVDLVYRARWEQGRDICSRETIGEIGAELGLDPAAIAAASEDEQLRAEGAAVMVQAGRDGAFGVPFFVHGFTRFWGVDRLDAFAAHVRSAAAPAQRLPEPVAGAVGLGRSPDDGHAGGCG
ncbi:2-hydroxychromene-2-carboxylate isomerase [Kutzneria viridogrisea]|uniref:2-hydroxychromene-2-carboxylate isomerase n=2 Tax=Kutzneria TaxID=43356 RepID=W5WEH9_9PSEU|nr:DsbA family protein [Kutzneria albida]AHH99247.1 hypothetical protein KALB_5886 [Kutzneria albida DSM 43870]MBA8923199.1 2-hydroxychromene-2-carboxylate isomerase [Kutzneria viridogrisea]